MSLTNSNAGVDIKKDRKNVDHPALSLEHFFDDISTGACSPYIHINRKIHVAPMSPSISNWKVDFKELAGNKDFRKLEKIVQTAVSSSSSSDDNKQC